tara:strand:- start:1100 stop:1519 length:420 start_codon:yes stop_codon:yes gene_type:complete
MHNGYFAVVLDEKSCDAVKKYSTMDVVNGDHITIAYKPEDKIFHKLSGMINENVDAYIGDIRSNENIEALWVEEMYLPGRNKRLKRVDKGSAHITISHKKDFKPGDAKSMFEDPDDLVPIDRTHELAYLKGKIKWISYE